MATLNESKPEIVPFDMGGGYQCFMVGGWSFDDEDMSLPYIDSAIAAWTAWREYVVAKIEEAGAAEFGDEE